MSGPTSPAPNVRVRSAGGGWPRRGRVVGASVRRASGACAVAMTAGCLSFAAFAATVDGDPLATSIGGAKTSTGRGLCLRSCTKVVVVLPGREGAYGCCRTCLSNVCTERTLVSILLRVVSLALWQPCSIRATHLDWNSASTSPCQDDEDCSRLRNTRKAGSAPRSVAQGREPEAEVGSTKIAGVAVIVKV